MISELSSARAAKSEKAFGGRIILICFLWGLVEIIPIEISQIYCNLLCVTRSSAHALSTRCISEKTFRQKVVLNFCPPLQTSEQPVTPEALISTDHPSSACHPLHEEGIVEYRLNRAPACNWSRWYAVFYPSRSASCAPLIFPYPLFDYCQFVLYFLTLTVSCYF
jgi:hypothetical protein